VGDRSLAAVAQLLERHGIRADVTRAGQAGDIAAIRASVDRLPDIRRLSDEIRALGFRYVTLELTTSEES